MRKRLIFLPLLPFASFLNLYAEPAEITGEISTGSEPSSDKVGLTEISPSDIRQETVVERGGRRIIYQEIDENSPDEVLKSKSRPPSETVRPPVSTPSLPRVYYSVWAQILPSRHSLIRWWNGSEEHYAWSNVDFTQLVGFNEFKKNGKSFSFQLFAATVSEENLASTLASIDSLTSSTPPVFEENRPGFQLISDTPEGSDADNLILGLHEIFSQREADLRAAALKRKENARARELAASKPKPAEDIIIRYKASEDPIENRSE